MLGLKMIPPSQNPREFWIEPRYREVTLNEVPTMGHVAHTSPVLKDGVHVIEISAVTRLQAQLACAKEALEFYADPKTYESKREREIKIGDYFAWECSFPIKEDHDGDKARAALAAISEEKD